MSDKPKKKWTTPKLLILVRSRSEESVLQACKGQGKSGPGGNDCIATRFRDPCQGTQAS